MPCRSRRRWTHRSYNRFMLRRFCFILLLCLLPTAASSFAQTSDSQDLSPNMQNQAPPRSDDRSPGESSSKDTRIDLSAPSGDEKMHPNSGVADDVMEMHPYDPHKAEKNVEVGDFYFNLKNYRAAESRYQEALQYKPNDAEATYKLGVAQENLGESEDALASFKSYLKILPGGPHAAEAQDAVARISNPAVDRKSKKEGKKEKKKKGM